MNLWGSCNFVRYWFVGLMPIQLWFDGSNWSTFEAATNMVVSWMTQKYVTTKYTFLCTSFLFCLPKKQCCTLRIDLTLSQVWICDWGPCSDSTESRGCSLSCHIYPINHGRLSSSSFKHQILTQRLASIYIPQELVVESISQRICLVSGWQVEDGRSHDCSGFLAEHGRKCFCIFHHDKHGWDRKERNLRTGQFSCPWSICQSSIPSEKRSIAGA